MADEPSTSKGATKNPSGKILKSGQRLMAHNIYLKYKENGLSKTQAVVKSAAEVGIGKGSMWKIVGDMETAGIVESPSKKRSRGDIFSKLTEDEKKAVKHIVHAFFYRNHIPTLDKVLHAVEENDLIPSMSRSSLFKVLKNLGFVWEKRGRTHHILSGQGDNIDIKKEFVAPEDSADQKFYQQLVKNEFVSDDEQDGGLSNSSEDNKVLDKDETNSNTNNQHKQ